MKAGKDLTSQFILNPKICSEQFLPWKGGVRLQLGGGLKNILKKNNSTTPARVREPPRLLKE